MPIYKKLLLYIRLSVAGDILICDIFHMCTFCKFLFKNDFTVLFQFVHFYHFWHVACLFIVAQQFL